ncbi:MAG: ubiquinol-cytochrome c reductase iron-sulfur subunit [Caldilineaceae bacterium]|nr:ubiquinol-cytochrome c reductase iron-sulfur subunit [Caldilineaceae bacterium]
MELSQPDHMSEDAQHEWEQGAPLSRRQFLEAGLLTTTAVTGVALAGVGARFLVGDALVPRVENWIRVGELTSLPAGQIHRVAYSVRMKDAWRTTERKGLVYVFTDDGQEYTVLSSICTHLGCNVRWIADCNCFQCPCHHASFSREGEVLSGPPQEPLLRLQTKLEDGVLFALI